MRKLTVKILCAFLFVLSAALLAACGDGVVLKEGAVVTLNVQTEAEEFEVSSTYGTVQGSGKAYTVTVETKKDFAISVSAEGLKTQVVPVTVADLASGSCTKSVELKDELLKEISVTVSGDVENVSVACDGVDFTLKRGVYTGMLTRTQIEKGITVSADNAVTRTLTFTDKQLENSYLKADTFLVQAGSKVIELRGNMGGKFLVDAENHLISVKPIYEQSQYGGRDYVGGRVVLDSEYEGNLYLKEVYGYPDGDITIEIEKNLPTYGTEIEFISASGNDDNYQQVEVKNFDMIDNSGYNSYQIFVEVEEYGTKRLQSQSIYQNENSDENGIYYYYYMSIPKSAYAIWDITESGARRAVYDGERIFDWNTLQTVEFEPYVCLYDKIFEEPRTDIDTVYYYDENLIEWEDWDEHFKPISVTDGTVLWDWEVYGNTLYLKVGEVYNSNSIDAYSYIQVNGKWCNTITRNKAVTYQITLQDKAGNPVSGAVFARYYGDWDESDFDSVSNGVYQKEFPTGQGPYSTTYYVKHGDKVECVVIDYHLNSGMWTRNGTTLEGVITLKEPESVGFYVYAYLQQTGNNYIRGNVTYTFTAVDEGVEVSKVDYLNTSDGCYVRAPYNGPIQIKVTVKIRYYENDEVETADGTVTIEPRKVWGQNYYSLTIYKNGSQLTSDNNDN